MVSRTTLQVQLTNACNDGDVSRIRELLAEGCLTAQDATESLRNACVLDLEVLRALLSYGADVGVADLRSVPVSDQPREALQMLAAYGYNFETDGHCILEDFARDRELIDWLVDHGVDINKTDSQRLDDGFILAIGESDNSLHLLNKVAADGDIDLFEHLVGRGAKASQSLALHAACRCDDSDRSVAMIRHLLDVHHMPVNNNDGDMRTTFSGAHDIGSPLCSAIKHKNLAAVEELLRRGADPSYPYQGPVSYAVETDGFLPALKPLLRAGLDPTEALKTAIHEGKIEAVELCLTFGADPKSCLPEALEQEQSRSQAMPSKLISTDENILEAEEAGPKGKTVVDLLKSAISPRTGSRGFEQSQ